MTAADQSLCPEIAQVAAAVSADAGQTFSIPSDRFAELAKVLTAAAARAPEKVERFSVELVALMLKFNRLASERTRLAVAQLFVLLALVRNNLAEAEGQVPAEVRQTARREIEQLLATHRTLSPGPQPSQPGAKTPTALRADLAKQRR